MRTLTAVILALTIGGGTAVAGASDTDLQQFLDLLAKARASLAQGATERTSSELADLDLAIRNRIGATPGPAVVLPVPGRSTTVVVDDPDPKGNPPGPAGGPGSGPRFNPAGPAGGPGAGGPGRRGGAGRPGRGR